MHEKFQNEDSFSPSYFLILQNEQNNFQMSKSQFEWKEGELEMKKN